MARGRRLLCLALALLGLASPAIADDGVVVPASAVVRWRAPARCPSEQIVRAKIDARLDRPLAAGDVIEADIEVVRERRGFRARVTVWTPTADAQRELTARDCGSIANAVAVVVARAVAEARAVQPIVIEPGPTAGPGELPMVIVDIEAMPTVVPRRPVARVQPRPTWELAVRSQIGTDAGVVPHVGLSGELALVVTRGELAIEVEARRWRERLAELTPGSQIGAAIRLDAFAGRLCWQRPEVGPRACVIGEAGTMRGRGVGLSAGRDGTAPWSAVGLGLSMRTVIARRVTLIATFEMLQSIHRPRFGLDAGTNLHEPDRLCGRVAAGFEIDLF